MNNFVCLECGRKFKTVAAAERAMNDGCPGCNGVDIDVDVEVLPKKDAPKRRPVLI